MASPSEHVVEIRSSALLDALHRQAIRAPIHMTIVITSIAGLAIQKSPMPFVLAWVIAALGGQLARYVVISRLNRPHERGAKRRLHYAAVLFLVNGLVLASSIVFFAAFDETTRAIYTMIIVGLMSGAIASSHGYTPIFLGFAGPQLCALAGGWIIFPLPNVSSLQQVSLAILIGVLGLFLFSSSRDVFKAFEENFVLTGKLQTALEAETSANAAKTRFLAAASHDLRQPLHTMSMLSAALTLRPLDTESAKIATRINQAMAELSTELDSLLDISKMDAGVVRVRVSRFAVNPLIERLVQDYRPAAQQKGIDLFASLHASPTVESDKGLLERILRNLLDNAVKYTDSGSIIINVTEHESMCSIRVEDTGTGIPISEQSRVYEEFYQLHNSERDRNKGLGLGLSIVGRITKLLHADVDLVSTPGKGSTFSVTLQSVFASRRVANITEEGALLPTNISAPTALLADVHVLIVEDDLEVRRSMRTLLESVHIRVSEVDSTRQATRLVKEIVPDLALVDLRLPEGDSGYKTITALRNLIPELPIIIISGELTTDHAELVNVDNCEYLVKPVDMATLFDRIQRILESKESLPA